MINLSDLNTELYSIKHLSESDNEKIKSFEIKNSKGQGLANYLKHLSINEEKTGLSRTYLIEDTVSNELVAYFTLRTGLITVKQGFFSFSTNTGIELSNFAVNDAYRDANDVIPQLGKYIFITFILPLVKEISNYVGASHLYIFALPYNKLMEHYESMGFERMDINMERFIHKHIKPTYDSGCIFMSQKI
jgi:hypothetical protein